jgi:hypothetical protein
MIPGTRRLAEPNPSIVVIRAGVFGIFGIAIAALCLQRILA